MVNLTDDVVFKFLYIFFCRYMYVGILVSINIQKPVGIKFTPSLLIILTVVIIHNAKYKLRKYQYQYQYSVGGIKVNISIIIKFIIIFGI